LVVPRSPRSRLGEEVCKSATDLCYICVCKVGSAGGAVLAVPFNEWS